MAKVKLPAPISFSVRPVNRGFNFADPPQRIDQAESPEMMNVRFFRGLTQSRNGFEPKYKGLRGAGIWIDVVYDAGTAVPIAFTPAALYKEASDIFGLVDWYESATAKEYPFYSLDKSVAYLSVDIGEGKFDFTWANAGAVFPASGDYADIMATVIGGEVFIIAYTGVGSGVEVEKLNDGGRVGVPTGCRCCVFYDNRLVVATNGGGSNYATIQWSSKGRPDRWDSATYPDAGEEVIGDSPDWIQNMKRFGEYLIIYKERSIYIGRRSMLSDPAFYFDPAPGQGIGMAAPNSIGDLGSEQLFLGWDDVYALSLRGLTPIGTRIKADLFYGKNGILPEYVHTVEGIIAEEWDEYWLFVPSGKWPEAFNSVLNPTLSQVFNDIVDRGDCESATAPMLTPETVPLLFNATWARDGAQAHGGSYSFKFTKTVAAGTSAYAAFTDNEGPADMHGMIPGRVYKMVAWLYIPSGGILNTEIRLRGQYYDGSWTIVQTIAAATYDAWQKIEATMMLPKGAAGACWDFSAHADADINEYFYVDDVECLEYSWGIVADGDGNGSYQTGGNFGDDNFVRITRSTGTYVSLRTALYDFNSNIHGRRFSLVVYGKASGSGNVRFWLVTYNSAGGGETYTALSPVTAVTSSSTFQRFIFDVDVNDADAEQVCVEIMFYTVGLNFDIDAVQLVDIEDFPDEHLYLENDYAAPAYIGPDDSPVAIPLISGDWAFWETTPHDHPQVGPWLADTIWVYNYETDAWSAWRLPLSGFGYDTLVGIITIADLEGTVAEQSWRFDEKRIDVFAPTNLIAEPDGNIYEVSSAIAKDWKDIPGAEAPILAFWESKDYDLERPTVQKTVSRVVMLHETSHPATSVIVGVSLDSGVTWEEQTVTVRNGYTETYADFFVTGPQVRVRFKSSNPMFIMGFALKLVPRGESFDAT